MPTTEFTAAPGSIVVVRNEDWLVTAVEAAADGYFVHVAGLSERVRDTEAVFSTARFSITTTKTDVGHEQTAKTS